MKITIWEVFKYIYKWKIGILLIVIISLLFVRVYVNRNQTYTAEIIIRYTDNNAKSGYTPNGEKLDVYEITSPTIILSALEDLNIKDSVEVIRSRVTITPIIPTEVLEIQKSKTKAGEDYEYFATDYSVRYTVGSNRDGEHARDILDAIIKNYSIYYSGQYLNMGNIPEVDFDTNVGIHDYLEIAEIMETTTKDTISNLENYQNINPNFRSALTGLSFTDIITEYNIIKEFDLPALFQNILNSQITQNKEVLLKKYIHRKEQYILQNTNKINESDIALSLMEAFADSSKSVPNAYNREEPGQDFNTHDIIISDRFGKTKTTYDNLVDNYVQAGVNAENMLVDAVYCENVISAFSNPVDEGIDFNLAKESADKSIRYIKTKLSDLYIITHNTMKNYNELNASNNIVSLSGINIISGIAKNLYYLLAMVIGSLLGIIMAITIEIVIKLKKELVE